MIAVFVVAFMGRSHAADWLLEMVPIHLNAPIQTIRVGPTTTAFYASLTNKSDRPLMVWKEWCSLGYFNLTFECTRGNGEVFALQRIFGYWTRSFPDPYWVKPGEFYSWPVVMDSNWGGFPKNWKNGVQVKIRAVYENVCDPNIEEMDRKRDQKELEMDEKIDQQLEEEIKEKKLSAEALSAHQSFEENRKRSLDLYRLAWTGKVFSAPSEVTLYQNTSAH